MKIAIKV